MGALDGKLAFHCDTALATAMISLNGEDEFTGSRLLMLTSAGIVCPRRGAGDAIVIDNNLVHGVTRLCDGVRYALFAFFEDGGSTGDGTDYGFPLTLAQAGISVS